MNVKVVTPELRSICPAIAHCEGRQIAGPLQYAVGRWTEALPNSLGLFFFEVEETSMEGFLATWGKGSRVFECEAQGVRPIGLVINPGHVLDALLPKELAALHSQWPALCGDERFQRAPRGIGYRTMTARRLRLVRELKNGNSKTPASAD